MLQKIIWTGLLLRLFVAIWNGFFGPSYGADADAVNFHLAAVAYASNLELDEFRIGWIYSYVLGAVYYATTSSLFIGSVFSCLAWRVSAGTLTNTMRLMSLDKSHQLKAMLIYALLPSSILLTSITLRESYQLLFVNLAVYSALKIYLKKSATHWLVLIFAILGLGALHGGLFAFGLYLLIATSVLLTYRGGKGVSVAKLAFFAPFFAFALLYGVSFFSSVSYNLDGGVDAAVQTYQEGALGADARAQYKSSSEINGVTSLLLFIPLSFLQYLFEPMPWRIATAADAELFLENVLRAWLLWRAWIGLRNMPAQGRRPVLFVFLSYLSLEVIWSLGTINWGTAIRHHIPSMGLLLIAAFAYAKISTRRRAVVRHVKGLIG